MKRIVLSALVLPAMLAMAAAPAAADGWGSVTGKFVVNGNVPELPPLVKEGDPAAKDPAVCAAEPVPDDSLVVSDAGGLKNVVLFVNRFKGDIHPEAAKRPDEVVFDQKGCQFIPHILVVQAGQTVLVKSDDDCAHNARGALMRNDAFNLTVPPNERQGIKVETQVPELLPLPIKCDIHPYMIAHWLVVDHPYATVSAEDGTFTIENLPAGSHTIKAWHERPGYVGEKRGFKIDIEDGQTVDLGTIEIDAKDLLEN